MIKHWYEVANDIRRQKGITLQDIANALNVTEGAVGHWLRGRRDVRYETIKRIANVLNVPVTTLTENDPNFARTDDERNLLDKFREIPDEKKADLLRIIEALIPQK
jgi:transcriptional regulator with XRE-family HTH domain